MPAPLCLFHKNCLDGAGAAAVVNRVVPDCDFLPVQYGEELPQVDGRTVYLVDFGYPLAAMRALRAQASRVVWIDHHASQVEVHRQLGWGHLDLEESGATLTWKVLCPLLPPPPVLAYIRDKDLWRWQLPDSRAINAGLDQRFRMSFRGVLEADLAEMAAIGGPLLDKLAARVRSAVTAGTEMLDAFGLPGVRALAVPCNQDQNDVGDHICLPVAQGGLGYDLAVIYYFKKQTRKWIHSLRSSKVDCAAVAAKLGGGGHPASAAFLTDAPIVGS